jgi:hypothetical protein
MVAVATFKCRPVTFYRVARQSLIGPSDLQERYEGDTVARDK